MSMRDSIAAARTSGPVPEVGGAQLFEFHFPAADPVFAGHFPGRPLLPGVFQLEIVRLAAEMILNCRLAVREVVRAKFQRPVVPHETLKLNLMLTGPADAISARGRFTCGGQPAGETLLKLCRNE